MKNHLALLFIITTFYSCSSAIKQLSGKSSTEPTEEELASIENSDFLQGKRVRFKKEFDNFEAINRDSDTDSLMYESIARIPEYDLKSISETQDPISKIISLCYRREYEDAEKVLDDVYKQYKNHPSYWNQVGTCYYLRGDLRKALLYYNKSRSLSKKYAPPINNLGVIYQRRGFDQKALLAFKKASDLSSFSLTPVFNLAHLYLKYGFSKRARTIFESLRKKGSKDVDVIAGLATTYLMENNIQKSVELFSQIPDSQRKRPNVGVNFAIALKKIGRPKDAERVIENVDKRQLGKYEDYFKSAENYVRGK